MPDTIRLLPFQSADGPTHMAADEVLLLGAIRNQPSIRFYSWREPTVSLGYFQPAAERIEGLPWVRRSTGGAMLVHHFELTYALALPAGPTWQRRGESWICRMHRIISATLKGVGITTDSTVCGAESKIGPALCFLHHTPGDLIVRGSKVAGSAQRKQRGALLQHGGILLARSPHAPRLTGLQELTGSNVYPEELAVSICHQFAQETGWKLTLAEWLDDEQRTIRDIINQKYGNIEWNEKR